MQRIHNACKLAILIVRLPVHVYMAKEIISIACWTCNIDIWDLQRFIQIFIDVLFSTYFDVYVKWLHEQIDAPILKFTKWVYQYTPFSIHRYPF